MISGQAEGGDASGQILVNGQDRTTEVMREYSAYVRQNDRLLPHLTVKETLMFVAQLKLPKSWSHIKIEDRVGGEWFFLYICFSVCLSVHVYLSVYLLSIDLMN